MFEKVNLTLRYTHRKDVFKIIRKTLYRSTSLKQWKKKCIFLNPLVESYFNSPFASKLHSLHDYGNNV